MYQPQNPDFGSPGTKRPRTGPKGEGDWTCPSCGNVNFAFRTTCNMRKCSAPKPADGMAPQAPMQAYNQAPPLYEQPPPQQYVGGPGAPPPMPNYAAPTSYAPQMMVNPVAVPYNPNAPPAYPAQGGYVPVMGMQGPGYGGPPPMDNFGMNGGPRVMDMPLMGRPPFDQQQDGRKRRGGPEGGAEGDWVCPKCGNTNFAFRTVCNMRKCSAPKPVEAGHGFQGPPQNTRFGANGAPAREPEAASAAPPEGSWTCKACGNLNYPFRTSCNRRNCGVEKPADASAPGTAGVPTPATATVQ